MSRARALPEPARETAFWTACAALAALYVWLTSALRVQALFDAGYDDGLFLRGAAFLLRGQWLGPYDNVTLVKGAAYPVFLAAAYALGVPVMTAQAALYAAACGVVAGAVGPIVRSRPARLAIFAVMLFNPEVWGIWRIVRDYVYTGLSVAVLGFAAGAFARQAAPLRRQLLWLLGAGLSLGVLATTREETVWIAPPLAVIAAAVLGRAVAQRSRRAIARSLLSIGAPAAVALSVVGINAALNYAHYRTWVAIEMLAPDFGDAYGALQRVKPKVELRWVPVSAETRQRIYAASQTFARLRPNLDAVSRPWACPAAGRPECAGVADGEIPGAWFQWALRDAAAKQKQYATPATAAAFYRRMATEINHACETGALECLPPLSGLAPRLPADLIPRVAREAVKAVDFVLNIRSASPGQQLHVTSQGDSPKAEGLKVFHDAILPFDPVSGTTTIVGWVYAQNSPITLTVRDKQGVFWPTMVNWSDSPDVVRRAQSIGRAPDYAARARFAAVTGCFAQCQLFILGPSGALAISDVPAKGTGFGNAAIDGWVDEVSVTVPRDGLSWSGAVSDVDRMRLGVMDSILLVYRTALPAAAAAAAIAFALAGAATLARRTPTDAWWVALAFAAALASRIGLLAGIEATAYGAINALYMAPAFPMALGWCAFSLAALWSHRKRREQPAGPPPSHT